MQKPFLAHVGQFGDESLHGGLGVVGTGFLVVGCTVVLIVVLIVVFMVVVVGGTVVVLATVVKGTVVVRGTVVVTTGLVTGAAVVELLGSHTPQDSGQDILIFCEHGLTYC